MGFSIRKSNLSDLTYVCNHLRILDKIEAWYQTGQQPEEALRLTYLFTEKNLAIADDQMKTIMGDHMGFNDVLQELGASGILPSGERRAYGGYSN